MPAGNIADLSVAVQSAKGTPATPAASTMSRIYLTGGGIRALKETADLEETSASRLRSANFVSQVRADGSPEAYARPEMLGWLLWGAMGGLVTTGAGDPWTHTFTLANTQPYMTFWRMLGAALFEQFGDCKITSLKFMSQAGQPLKVGFDVVGLGPVWLDTAEATATVETSPTFMHADGKGQLQIESTAVSAIESFTLTIGLGTTQQQGDDIVPFQITEGMQEITVETTETIADFALYNRMVYGAATPTTGDAPSPNVVELSGAGSLDMKFSKRNDDGTDVTPERSIQFTATRLAIMSVEGIELNTNGDPLKQNVTYKVYQPSSGSGLTAVLLNGKTAYAAS